MELSDFDFELPEELIALRPARPRPASRLLVAEGADTFDSQVGELPRWLAPGDMLIFNDTKVIPARLFGERRRASPHGPGIARVEATLLAPRGAATWLALCRPAKRLAAGDVIRFGDALSAKVGARGEGGETLLVFDRAGAALEDAIGGVGVMPLPPYIASRRPADAQDFEDYQTVFARRSGSVAAPTAALHFDEALLSRLSTAGILSARLTLHVGAGTFLPVKARRIEEHRMHAERGEIDARTAARINAAKAAGGRIIPVGTTALRLLETAAAADGTVSAFAGETDIFIRPGYRFRVADGLMTNFHLPRSTLFMLVSALMGLDRMKALYAHAIARRYRFFSYGDSSLLLPGRAARGI